ncbi:MAG TPA: tetratricopeptide repeat protein [Burkholderiales bacterium]|jgi:hypothetical protein
MRKPVLLLFAAALLCGTAAPAFADLAAGKRAYAKKDYKRAFPELSAEAKRGRPEAMYLLGKMYAEGQGTAQDDAQAFNWFQKAADANNAPAQGMLGMFYAQGRGATRDNAKSVEWARRAADNGDALSQYMMGMRSLDGLGMPRDPDGAFTWFGSAAEQNYALAQYSLGVLMGFGPKAQGDTAGAHELRTEAAKWLMLAVRQKSPDVPAGPAKLDELKKRMAPKEIGEAELRVRRWRPTLAKKS